MATGWYWRDAEVENGPISFHNLVALVKDGIVIEDNLVRPDYSREWQHADSVVGLFNMARRVPRERLSLSDRSRDEDAIGTQPIAGNETAVPGSDDDLARWMLDQLAGTPLGGVVAVGSVGSGQSDLTGQKNKVDGSESDGSNVPGENCSILNSESLDEADRSNVTSMSDGSDGRILSAIDAAMEHLDRRENARRGIRGWRMFRWYRGSGVAVPRDWVRHGFRWGVAFGVAWMAGSMVNSWADQESLKYPGFKTEMRSLPLVGECSPDEYAFFTWDFVLAAGVGAYFVARSVEAKCE